MAKVLYTARAHVTGGLCGWLRALDRRPGSATTHSTARERVSMCLTSVSYEPGDAVGFGWVAARSGMGFTTVASWL